MRPYLLLLRLPYQLQLGPIFAWGFLLAGGRFDAAQHAAAFALVFGAFHIGAFGGLTALNSFYDRDTGPVGGLWQPPTPPPHLWAFAWGVQWGGWLLLWGHFWLQLIYGSIVLLALGYSHPRLRWKGHPWKSWAIVALGQGVLDYLAGALVAPAGHWNMATTLGLGGATFSVLGMYPLTQLFQIEDDRKRGDRTLAVHLAERFGRKGVLLTAALVLTMGVWLNAGALWAGGRLLEARWMTILSPGVPLFLWVWAHQGTATSEDDFRRVSLMVRGMALAFGTYIGWRLLGG